MAHKGKAPPNKRTRLTKNLQAGVLPGRKPELIPDTPENVALAAMQGSPKKRWRYEEDSRRHTA